MELRLRILQWLSLLLLSADIAGWRRRFGHETGFRQCEMPPRKVKLKLSNTHRIRIFKNELMESHLQIIQWLSLLFLSAGFIGWSRKARQDNWFRRCEMPPGKIKFKIPNTHKIRHLQNEIMDSRLRILRWLSLLLLSAGLVSWSQRMSVWALFRRPKMIRFNNNQLSLKFLKQSIQTSKRTMVLQLKILHWLSLLLLSESLRWQSQNMAYFSGFQQP
jgi:hypothetical protein